MASLLVRAAWVCPVRRPPLRRRLGAASNGGRIAAVGQGHDAPPADRDARSRAGGGAARTGQRAHPPRAVVAARPGAAGGGLPDLGRAADAPADPARDRRRRGRRCRRCAPPSPRCGPPAPRRSATSPTRWCRRRCCATAVMPAVVFHELLGFRDRRRPRRRRRVAAARAAGAEGAGVRVVVGRARAVLGVAGALHGDSRRGARDGRRRSRRCTSASRREEVQLLRDGTGPWRTRLEELGAWRDDWTPPGRGPGDYLCDLGVIARRHAGRARRAAHRPRAGADGRRRRHAGDLSAQQRAGSASARRRSARFFASGVRVAVGTDSLASAPDLNLFAELAAMRAAAPGAAGAPDPRTPRPSAGAEALGLDDELGSLQPGRRAAPRRGVAACRAPPIPRRRSSAASPRIASRCCGPSRCAGGPH